MKTGKTYCGIVCSCLVGLSASIALAHGPQIQVGIADGQVVTRALFVDEPYDQATTPIQRVYQIEMTERSLGDANDGWYTQPSEELPFTGPGIATALGGFGVGTTLTLTFADGLKIWDGSAFVDPGTEQIDAYRGVTHVAGAVTSDGGPFQSFDFTPIAGSADEHKTAYFRLLGDGASPNTTSDDGVYLLTLQLSADESGMAASAPYYFVLNKNASAADVNAAMAYVSENIWPWGVPAVSSWGCIILLVGILIGATIRLRSTRRHGERSLRPVAV